MDGDVLSVERVIAASPGQVFQLISDAARHPLFDGSGTVRAARDGAAEPLQLGSVFGMSMRVKGLGYVTVNEVVEYDENRLIAWQTRGGGFLKRLVGGRIWRYELHPVQHGTLVRESWDISRDTMRLALRLTSFPALTRTNMERSLERIERVVAVR